MALPQYPKFCNIHQVIHICENMDPMFLVKKEEEKLASKVRRLHGKQTEEELEVERLKNAKNTVKKGSLADILANAKKNISIEKNKLKGGEIGQDSSSDDEGKIDETSLSNRMLALRAKTLGESEVTTIKPVLKNKTEESPTKNSTKVPFSKLNNSNENNQINQSSNSSSGGDYLTEVKERHQSMYSAVRMSELRQQRPKAAIHLPKKRSSAKPKIVGETKVETNSKNITVKKTAKITTPSKTNSTIATKNKTSSVIKQDKSLVQKATNSSKITKKDDSLKISKEKLDKPVFTKAETKKLIEEAVKIALKKVGKIE
ncbi:hypothetical protein SSABA_v1c04800 [Spiroplasma sabaudiense Ar-1343]|uniref:Uncharacterized protein n=1 Tax=Spiroplasma sabaudiense Ar-1343 TaxID=1276257 RepID=W6AA09_9MOLU|nr:hypothetical protein [Spiroplasma sabaudiense]AHI53887.1 hypothetical protein SSABA_v1c04800 [Spiroplasma sabaudiense Ar-1343]